MTLANLEVPIESKVEVTKIVILLLEDDRSLREQITYLLMKADYIVHSCETLAQANRVLATEAIQLMILDWNLPDGDGLEFLLKLRSEGMEVPVLFLTARKELNDRILGLEQGANDYLTKPFEPRELLARVRVQTRTGSTQQIDLEENLVRINRKTREVFVDGNLIEFKKMEYELLAFLMENAGRVFSRDELLNRVWGMDKFPSNRTVDTHILLIRKKIGESKIDTIRGVGYRFNKSKLP